MVEFIVTLDVERDIFTRRDLQAEGKEKCLNYNIKTFDASKCLARITRFSKFLGSSALREISITLSVKTEEEEGRRWAN